MPKGFQPGNKLWKLGVDSKIERKEVLKNFLEHIGVNGIKRYEDLLEKVGSDEAITQSERLFMQKIENLFEYIMPKLNRTELTGKDGGDVGIKINVVNFYDQKKLDK